MTKTRKTHQKKNMKAQHPILQYKAATFVLEKEKYHGVSRPNLHWEAAAVFLKAISDAAVETSH